MYAEYIFLLSFKPEVKVRDVKKYITHSRILLRVTSHKFKGKVGKGKKKIDINVQVSSTETKYMVLK